MRTNPDEPDASARREPPDRHALAELAGLSPAYFGMVMATGIVSLAAHLLAMPGIARALFQLNIVVYAVLWLLIVLRMAWYPRRLFGDIQEPLRHRPHHHVRCSTWLFSFHEIREGRISAGRIDLQVNRAAIGSARRQASQQFLPDGICQSSRRLVRIVIGE